MIAKRTAEHGNVLFIILIAVALFGALSFTVGNMMRGGTSSISNEQARIAAGEILQYAQTVREAVQMLRISNGCDDDEISFENSTVSGYTNASAPSDNTCHVFHPDGGGLSWISPSANSNDGTPYHFESRRVQDIGTDSGSAANELIIGLAYVDENICKAINKAVHDFDGDPYDILSNFSTWGTGRFTGAYGTGGHINYGETYSAQHMSACFQDRTNPTYHFFSVLIAR